jgi:hypothetical protein
MKTYGGSGCVVPQYVIQTSALVGGELPASRTGHFTPGERAPDTYWIGGWVGPRAKLLDYMELYSLLFNYFHHCNIFRKNALE